MGGGGEGLFKRIVPLNMHFNVDVASVDLLGWH